MSNRRSSSAAEVHTITSAAVPLGADIDRRARRYLAQMAVRTLCFVAAVATFDRVPTWATVSMIVGAVVLPYVAVILANAGRERPERPEEVLYQHRLAATGAPTPWPDADVLGGPGWRGAPQASPYPPGAGTSPFPPPVDLPRPTTTSGATAPTASRPDRDEDGGARHG